MCKQFLEKGKEKLDVVYDDMDMVPGPGGWLEDNPFGVRSDWESHVLARGDPMYRLMLCKRQLLMQKDNIPLIGYKMPTSYDSIWKFVIQ